MNFEFLKKLRKNLNFDYTLLIFNQFLSIIILDKIRIECSIFIKINSGQFLLAYAVLLIKWFSKISFVLFMWEKRKLENIFINLMHV